MAGRVETTRLQFQISINGEKKVVQSIKELKKERRQLNQEIEAGGLSVEEYNQKVLELRKINGVLRDHRKSVSGLGQGFNEGKKGATGFAGIMQKLGPIINTALGPIGLFLAAAGYLVKMATAAFQASQEMQKLRERINQVSGLVGEDLDQAAAKAQSLGNAFEVDVTKGIDAANAAANVYRQEGEELGDTYQRSLDGIADRLAGLDGKGDEFLEQVSEYSVQAKKAGIEMDEFFNIVTASINRGVPTDKLIDSIKEFDIRIKDISKGQREVLERTFGTEFTDKLISDIESGKTTGIEALRELSGEIEILGEDSADAQKVISNLFGGPGEDATAQYLSLIREVDGSIDSVIDTTNVYYRRKQELYDLERQANEAVADLSAQLDGSGQVFQKVGLILKTGFIKFLADGIEFVRYFPEYFAAATSSGKAFANTLISAFEGLILKLSPFRVLLEKLLGIEIKFPRFELENDPYAEVEAKIEADRQAFADRQRQKALADQQKQEEASRLQALQAAKRRDEQLANLTAQEKAKLAKLEADAQRNLEDLRIAVMEEGIEKQIALLRLKANREISALKGTGAQKEEAEKLIRKKLNDQIEALNEKYREKEKKARKDSDTKALKEREEQFKKEKQLLENAQVSDALTITQNVIYEIQNGAEIIDADEEIKRRLLEKEKKFLEDRKALYEKFGEDTTAIEQAIANLDLAKITEKKETVLGVEKEKYEKIIEIADAAAQTIGQISSLISANNQRKFNEDVAELEKAKEKELSIAGDNQDKRAAIEEKFAKKEEALRAEHAKKEKRVAIVNALINTALSVTKALASAFPPANFYLAAGNAAAGAAQIAAIKAQEYAYGGLLPEPGKGGLPIGPSHEEGHIFLIDGKTGKVRGAIEGGEPILSKKTYENNTEIVNELLNTSMNHGGKRIYERGGIEGTVFQGTNTTVSKEVVETTKSSSEMSVLADKMDELITAYREGKRIMVSEKEVEMFGEIEGELEEGKIRRAL